MHDDVTIGDFSVNYLIHVSVGIYLLRSIPESTIGTIAADPFPAFRFFGYNPKIFRPESVGLHYVIVPSLIAPVSIMS